MTVVVAIKKDDVVYLGCDTQSTFDSIKRNFLSPANFKIQKTANDVLIAGSGRLSLIQELVFRPELFENISPEECLTKKYIVQNVVPQYKKALDQKGEIDEKGKTCCEIFLAWKDRLFTIDGRDDFSVNKFSKCTAMGSGSDFALPYLTDESLGLHERMLEGMRCADKFDSGVSGPFVFIDTKDMQYNVVD